MTFYLRIYGQSCTIKDSFGRNNPSPSITSENVLCDLIKMAARDNTSISLNIPRKPSCSS